MTAAVDNGSGATGATPLAADDQLALRRAYAVETALLVRARLDISIVLFLVFMGIVVLFERRMPGHGSVVVAYAVEAFACAAAFALTHSRRFARHTIFVAAATTSLLALAMIVYSAVVHSHADAVAIGQVCLMTCLAVVLPWGWRAQLALAVTSLASFVAVLPMLETTSPTLFALVGMLSGATSSCVAAFFLDRYRFQAFTQAAERSRAYVLQQEEAEISTALLHVGQTLSRFVGRAELLDQVNRLVTEALGCDWASTYVFDEQSDTFRFVGSAGARAEINVEAEQIAFPTDSMPVFGLLHGGRVVEIADAREQDVVPPELLRRWDCSSVLIVPIRRNDATIGFVSGGYRTRTGPFSRKQRRLARGIAQAVAVGLDNERLIRDLRAANRLKSDFVSTMSHELRTPLNVILGYAEMLCEDRPLTQRDVQQLAQRILRSASDLLELVTATLDLGRMESGRDLLRIELVPVASLFEELDTELEPLSRRAGLTLRWHNGCGDDVLPTDRIKLKTILKNLVGNAIKYTPQGEVDVRVERIGDDVVFTVEDTGIGIEQQHLSTIFDMFRQLDGSPTRTYGGVGLGLYIVRQLVDRLRGRIEVASTVGRGSTFTVRLSGDAVPASDERGAAAHSATPAPSATAARSG